MPVSLLSRSLLVASAFAFAPAAFSADDAGAAAQRYLTRGEQVLAALEAGTADATAVAADIDVMLDDAKPVLAAYGAKHADCDAQIRAMVGLYDRIAQWTAAEIRTNIERGAALPAGTGCYPARDVVAHPAIVRALVRDGIQDGETARLVRELGEAVEHMEGIRDDLGLSH